MPLLSKHLRGQIRHRATKTGRFRIRTHPCFRQTEISQQSMPIRVEDYVVGLQISENDLVLVEVL